MTVVEEHVNRIEGVNGDLTAYVTVLGDEARERARDIERALADGDDIGPLARVLVGLKDVRSQGRRQL